MCRRRYLVNFTYLFTQKILSSNLCTPSKLTHFLAVFFKKMISRRASFGLKYRARMCQFAMIAIAVVEKSDVFLFDICCDLKYAS